MGFEVVPTNSHPHVSCYVLNSTRSADGQCSAHADVKANCLAVANLHDGVDLYNIPNMQLIKSYPHGNINSVIFKVSFIDSDWLISGGQDGSARLYDVQSGQFLEKLDHDSGT
jgi:WD40 repeat protein